MGKIVDGRVPSKGPFDRYDTIWYLPDVFQGYNNNVGQSERMTVSKNLESLCFSELASKSDKMVATRCLVASTKGCGSCRATSTLRTNVPLMQPRFRMTTVTNTLHSNICRYGNLSGNSTMPRAVPETQGTEESKAVTLSTSVMLMLMASMVDSSAAYADGMTSSPPASSYYVSLGLFLFTLPGLWSLIKRSPKAKMKRKTFEVAGPAVAGHMPLDTRARQIFNYFKNYNYSVKETGEVIVFEGNYRASVGQAAALVLYTAISLASTALVLSIAAPFGGNWWYLMTLISPAAGAYYFKNADRTEEFQVKMTTSDDDKTTDITVQGDEEEIDRFRKELELYEKGMEYVKGILE